MDVEKASYFSVISTQQWRYKPHKQEGSEGLNSSKRRVNQQLLEHVEYIDARSPIILFQRFFVFVLFFNFKFRVQTRHERYTGMDKLMFSQNLLQLQRTIYLTVTRTWSLTVTVLSQVRGE